MISNAKPATASQPKSAAPPRGKRNIRSAVITTAVLALAFMYPLFDTRGFGVAPDVAISTLADAGVYIMLALGLNIVIGYAGLLDLGYTAFFAIGSYTYALLASPRFNLHLADRLFKGKALPGDIRVQERVLVRAHMRDGFTRPLVDRLARFIGVCVEPFYGAGYERIVLVHSNA